jgi:hypothetical protein
VCCKHKKDILDDDILETPTSPTKIAASKISKTRRTSTSTMGVEGEEGYKLLSRGKTSVLAHGKKGSESELTPYARALIHEKKMSETSDNLEKRSGALSVISERSMSTRSISTDSDVVDDKKRPVSLDLSPTSDRARNHSSIASPRFFDANPLEVDEKLFNSRCMIDFGLVDDVRRKFFMSFYDFVVLAYIFLLILLRASDMICDSLSKVVSWV